MQKRSIIQLHIFGKGNKKVLRTDCVNFEYEHDMGKSIPCCKITKCNFTACPCDTGTHYIDDCDGCDKYERRDYSLLESIIRGKNIEGDQE